MVGEYGGLLVSNGLKSKKFEVNVPGIDGQIPEVPTATVVLNWNLDENDAQRRTLKANIDKVTACPHAILLAPRAPFRVSKEFQTRKNNLESVDAQFLRFFGDMMVARTTPSSFVVRTLLSSMTEKELIDLYGGEANLEVTLDVLLFVLNNPRFNDEQLLCMQEYHNFFVRDPKNVLRRIVVVCNGVTGKWSLRLPYHERLEDRVFSVI
jgi:hypothetical protein